MAIVTDGSADVPMAERRASARGVVAWLVVPERWRSEGADIVDDGSENRQLTQLVLGDLQIEVSEPGAREFREAYTRLRHVDRVFSIHPPTSVSHAVGAAREAAGNFPNVRVINAGVSGIGVGLLASRACAMAAAGAGSEVVENWLRDHRSSVRMLVVPDRFDPTAGQRGTTTRLLTGGPLLDKHSTGQLDRSRRLRSRDATVAAIEGYFAEHAPEHAHISLAVGHADAAGAVDPFLDLLERIRPTAQVDLVGRIGPRLVQQLRTRCVGAAWLVERTAVADAPPGRLGAPGDRAGSD